MEPRRTIATLRIFSTGTDALDEQKRTAVPARLVKGKSGTPRTAGKAPPTRCSAASDLNLANEQGRTVE